MAARSPLEELHAELGAKLTEFGGWNMPLQYEGVVSEHNAVRTGVGIFDVSHLGKLRVRGAAAGRALQEATTADVVSIPVGRARYALALADDGGCIDDLFVYRLDEEEWLVVPNAANTAAVAEAIAAGGARPDDEGHLWAIIAVQGPASFDVLDAAFPGSEATALALHAWAGIDVLGAPGIVARTGYTGERGFELYVPAPRAVAAFRALLRAGATPVGLGARDTLRLEMGYALYGHELRPDVNPLEAGLDWALEWEVPFRGRDALALVRAQGPARRLFGIECRERGIPRQGHPVHVGSEEIGTVTSGNFSPTLQTGIALALGRASAVPPAGSGVEVRARGRRIEGIIVQPPFLRRQRGDKSTSRQGDGKGTRR
jgi:aminomethyltransferase